MRKKVYENYCAIGKNIKKARIGRNLTQEELAELIDVTPQYLSDLERGVVGTSISTLIRLCQELDISSDLLLFGNSRETSSMLNALIERLQYLPKKKAALIERGLFYLIIALDDDNNISED